VEVLVINVSDAPGEESAMLQCAFSLFLVAQDVSEQGSQPRCLLLLEGSHENLLLLLVLLQLLPKMVLVVLCLGYVLAESAPSCH
jgi:hypothetical protein